MNNHGDAEGTDISGYIPHSSYPIVRLLTTSVLGATFITANTTGPDSLRGDSDRYGLRFGGMTRRKRLHAGTW